MSYDLNINELLADYYSLTKKYNNLQNDYTTLLAEYTELNNDIINTRHEQLKREIQDECDNDNPFKDFFQHIPVLRDLNVKPTK